MRWKTTEGCPSGNVVNVHFKQPYRYAQLMAITLKDLHLLLLLLLFYYDDDDGLFIQVLACMV